MNFPNGDVKKGYFSNNIYVGEKPDSESKEKRVVKP